MARILMCCHILTFRAFVVFSAWIIHGLSHIALSTLSIVMISLAIIFTSVKVSNRDREQ